MKKKILIYSLGVAVCFAVVGGMATTTAKKENVTVVTEEKKIPVRNAADTIDAGALSEEISLTENIDDTEGIEKTTEYLAYYFDVSIEKDGFIGGLKKICPSYEEVSVEEEETEKTEEKTQTNVEKSAKDKTNKVNENVTEETVSEEKIQTEEIVSGAQMVKSSIKAVGKEALARTYSEEKIKERLEFYGIHETKKKKSDIDSELKSYIVCAMDLGMIDEEVAQNALNGELSAEEQTDLLMAVANISGKGRNYIGYSNDEKIYADLKFVYGLYPSFTEEELYEAAGVALEDKNVTKCVLKKAEYDARFLPALTICYSHESIEHMEQLIGLLNRENIVAKVQLEPKMVITKEDIKKAEKAKEETSDKKESSEEKNVESIGTLKYDLVFEFETQEDMTRFNEVVEKYAKVQETVEESEETGKKTSDEMKTENETAPEDKTASENETVPVIADSEKEAVYMAEEAEYMLSDENTREIEKITIENDNGKLEFYCLLENTEEIKEKILELAKEQELSIGEVKTADEEVKEEPETEEAETEKIKTEKENSQTEKKAESEKKSQKKNTEAETKEEQTNTTKSEESKEEQTSEEKVAEKAVSEEPETEEILEYSLKLYSKKYTCNKEFFFKLGGVDKEETDEETEGTTTEQNTTEQNTTDKK